MSSQTLPLHKLVVLGCVGVGKSALTLRVFLDRFVEVTDPTICDNYRKQVKIDGQSCILDIMDTADSEEGPSGPRDQWVRDGDGVVLVYSISSRDSFTRVERYHRQVQRVKGAATASPPNQSDSPSPQKSDDPSAKPRYPITLVGNKRDMTTEREVSTQEGRELAELWGCQFMETSAKDDVNVQTAFFDMVRQLRRQRASVPIEHSATPRLGSTSSIDSVPKPSSRSERRTIRKGLKCIIL